MKEFILLHILSGKSYGFGEKMIFYIWLKHYCWIYTMANSGI